MAHLGRNKHEHEQGDGYERGPGSHPDPAVTSGSGRTPAGRPAGDGSAAGFPAGAAAPEAPGHPGGPADPVPPPDPSGAATTAAPATSAAPYAPPAPGGEAAPVDPATGLPARSYPGPGEPAGDPAGDTAHHGGATAGERSVPGGASYNDGAAYGEGSALGEGSAQGDGAAHRGDTAVPAAAAPLLPQRECDRLSERLQHTVTGFVDSPREAVREADALFEEAAENVAKALSEQRRKLRSAWEHNGGSGNGKGKDAHLDTEELRTALRDYRDLTERLLRV
ncbi:hypothetical protein DMH02_016515 [Streptomyces sp. WAC 00631]|nr:hypothetical protein [Streptomyces sp. WAC 00631]MCC5034779.1 hypothetical protein [Streptomyces sp. WAC 00631]